MRKLLILFILILIVVMDCSFAPNLKNLKPIGDTAQIVFHNQQKIIGELLAVNDSSIYVYINFQIHEINIRDLKLVTIEDYTNKKWIGAILGFEVLPTLLLGIAASSAGAKGGAIIGVLSIPTILNALIFWASEPESPGVKDPISPEQLDELKKYARFPQGLTTSQLKQFLASNKQSEIRYFK